MKLCFYRNIKSYFIALLFLSYSLIFCEQDQESHFNTHTVFHEDNEKTVTYEHCGSNDQGDYLFSATFEHTNYDTCQNVICSDVSLNYQSDENVQTPEQETLNNSSSDWNDCHDQTSDADQFDFNEIFNKQNENNSPIDFHQNYDDHQYQNQRSFIYVWCKAIKEDCLGSSKKTLQTRENQLQKQKDQKKKETEQLQQQDVKSELQQAYDQHQLSLESSDNKDFLQIVQQRNEPFDQSLKKPTHCTNQNFVLKNSTIGFMQANNIDHHQFTQLHGLPIQHHVTQELITNLNFFADIADENFTNQQLHSLIQSGVLVTNMAQNYNQASQFCDAISSTNCSHGLVHYLQGMMVSGHNRCQKLLTSLTFFNSEIAKYTIAVARGVSIGIVSSEFIDILIAGLGKGASIIAPQLTSLIYSGATSIIVPIALTVGTLCAAGIIIEGSRLGYLYGTNQLDNVAIELDRIKSFAHQLYSFDQAPEKHVENIAMLSTTLVWPWQKQAIFEHLMGVQKVTCNLLVDAKNIVQHTKKVTQNQLHHALEYVKNSELQHFDILYKKIFNEHIFDFVPKNQSGLVPAGMHGFIDPADKAMLSHVMKTTGSTTRGHGTKIAGKQMGSLVTTNCSQDAMLAVNNMIESAVLSDKSIKMFESLYEYLVIDRLVDGLAEIQGVRQINDFRTITKNFTDISQLTPHEVLYLNACNWFHPHFIEINELVKKENLCITVDGQDIKIDSFGLFHSLLGDMKPGKLETSRRGGHVFFPELKLQTHVLEDFKELDNGFFSLSVKHIKDSKTGDPKTFFPFGKTPLECTQIIIDAIKNPKKIKSVESTMGNTVVEITNNLNQTFKICIRSCIATFFRIKG